MYTITHKKDFDQRLRFQFLIDHLFKIATKQRILNPHIILKNGVDFLDFLNDFGMRS